eukprot:IDg6946t1
MYRTNTTYPLEKINITDRNTLTMADPARWGTHKLVTSEIFDIWGYPEGLDYQLFDLYTIIGFLSGGVELPLSAVRAYEWRNR